MSSTPLPPEGAHDGDRRHDADRLLHEEIRFEKPDIGTSKIVAVLFAIVLVFAGAGLLCLVVLRLNVGSEERVAAPAQYNASKEPFPAEPRLEPLDRSQATATADVFAKQLAMERTLHSYGNTNESGFVHIPIEQAMKLVAPTIETRQGDGQLPAKGFGLVGGGESNSGRLYSEAPPWLRENK